MRIVVDGDNLAHALLDQIEGAGRSRLCRLLGDLAERTKLPITVVFDGSSPPSPLAEQIGDSRIEVRYAGPRSADDVVAELIAAHSAPRRLTVVSSDHEVCRAARHRDCRTVKSEAFAAALVSPPPPRPVSAEPSAKQAGLENGESREWLEAFGLWERGNE